MDIVDELSKLVLTYVAAVNRHGGKLSEEAIDAYGAQPERIVFNDMYAAQSGRGILAPAQVSSETDEPWISDERYSHFLKRMFWSEVVDGSVRLTSLGHAVLEEASSTEMESESAIEVLIDPTNQFAYAKVLNKIAQLGESLVVDPYLNAETAIDLGQIDSVKRVLTGDRNVQKLKGRFAVIMRARPDFEIRFAEQSKLHDRYVVARDGAVIVLGSSLNSIAHRQGIITPLETLGSRFIADAYENLWESSRALSDIAGTTETGTVVSS